MSEDAAKDRGRAKAEAVLAALDDLDKVQLHCIGEHVVFLLRGAGPPLPPLTTFKVEAETWVKFSHRDELRAYLVEIWKALPDIDRLTFIGAVDPSNRHRRKA